MKRLVFVLILLIVCLNLSALNIEDFIGFEYNVYIEYNEIGRELFPYQENKYLYSRIISTYFLVDGERVEVHPIQIERERIINERNEINISIDVAFYVSDSDGIHFDFNSPILYEARNEIKANYEIVNNNHFLINIYFLDVHIARFSFFKL